MTVGIIKIISILLMLGFLERPVNFICASVFVFLVVMGWV